MKTKTTALKDLAEHLERISRNSRGHGGHGWTYDEEIEMLNAAGHELTQMHTALSNIERECSGALNNGFPEDAPDIIAHIHGIAVAALPQDTAAPSNIQRSETGEARSL